MSNIAKSLEADFAANATNEPPRLSPIATEYEIIKATAWSARAPQPADAGDGFARVHEATYNSAESAELDARLIPCGDDLIGKPFSPPCRYCGSRAADDEFHEGTCGNCGAPR